jgi:DNA polymerase-3 subunit alpha
MAQFADYGFNRSHSIAYAYVAYQTAYLKAHYPAFFYASVLSHESDNSAKVYKYSSELRSLGLELLPPDINESDSGFTPSENAVRFGLSALKGIGAGSTAILMEVRKEGKFTSLYDFVSRFDQGVFGKGSLEIFVNAGAFDSLKPEGTETALWRAKLFAQIEAALGYGQRAANDRKTGQTGLFGGGDDSAEPEIELPDAQPWTPAEISRREKAATGLYLTAHPLDAYAKELAKMKIAKILENTEIRAGDRLRFAGIASAVSVKYSKKGNRFCKFRLEDQTAVVNCLVWSDAYNKFGELIQNDELLIVEGRVESADGADITFIVDEADILTEAAQKNASSVTLTLPANASEPSHFEAIFEILSRNHGKCEVFLNFAAGDVDVKIAAVPLRVQGSKDLEIALRSKGCDVKWETGKYGKSNGKGGV